MSRAARPFIDPRRLAPMRKATLQGVAVPYRIDGRYRTPATLTVDSVYPTATYLGVARSKSRSTGR